MTDDELCADVHANLCYTSDKVGALENNIENAERLVKRRLTGCGITNHELRRQGGNLRYTARKLRELADYIDTTAEMLESL